MIARLTPSLAAALLFALPLSGAPAEAQVRAQVMVRYSTDYDRCMHKGDAARGVTLGMMKCMGDEIDRQDERLNAAYKLARSRLDGKQRKVLRNSERAWIKQREATCTRLSARDGGGTASALGQASCVIEETIKRTIWLERYRG